jgi:hypothetical protein
MEWKTKLSVEGTHDMQVSNTAHGNINLWNCTYFLSQIKFVSRLSWLVTLVSRFERIGQEKLTAFLRSAHHELQFCRRSPLCFLELKNSV